MDKKLIIVGVSKPMKEKERIDGKAQREFVKVTYAQAHQAGNGYYGDPNIRTTRNLFQVHSPDGKKADWRVQPSELENLMTNRLPIIGEVVTKKVETFPVIDAVTGEQSKRKDGSLVTADRYTTVILGKEDVTRVFAAAGHTISGEVTESTPVYSEREVLQG